MKFTYGKKKDIPPEELKDTVAFFTVSKIFFTLLLSFLAYKIIFHNDYSYNIIDQSGVFIHEFGHLIFAILVQSPLSSFGLPGLGKFLTYLGGTLTQLGVPIFFLCYFLKEKKMYSAWFCLYWVGTYLGPTARYIADARCICLPAYASFVKGDPNNLAAGHDWNFMLSKLGILANDIEIAKVVSVLGIVVLSLSLALMVFDFTYKAIKKEV